MLGIFVVLDRPPSQMSFLEQFLKESSFRGSLESEEGDVEDNSSKSNLSELSTVGDFSRLLLQFSPKSQIF